MNGIKKNGFLVAAFCLLASLCLTSFRQVTSSSDALQVTVPSATAASTGSIQVEASSESVRSVALDDSTSDSLLTKSELYYEVVKDRANVDWEEEIPIFHYWRDIRPDEYLFNVPTQERIEEWKRLCEEENRRNSVAREYIQRRWHNMNHYMTALDFPYEQKELDDAFVEWRLEQYYLGIRKPESEYERFMYLKSAINSLCDYSPQTDGGVAHWSRLRSRLDLFYSRILRKELMRHSSGRLAEALAEENLAWEAYHTQLISTYKTLHFVDEPCYNDFGSLTCAIQISGDNAQIRNSSLEDFYFALTDGADYEMRHGSSRVRHTDMPESRVLQEYENFIEALGIKNYNIWASRDIPLEFQENALRDEMNAWKRWIQSRKSVSSLLDGFVKDAYDNSTNNALRSKYIMLKNRYAGYGIISDQCYECLIDMNASDKELDGPSFEVRWLY